MVRRRIEIMREAGITFKTNTNIGVDITRDELEEQFDAIIYYYVLVLKST